MLCPNPSIQMISRWRAGPSRRSFSDQENPAHTAAPSAFIEKNACIRAQLLCLIAVSLAGCAQQVRIDSAWQEHASRELSFKKMLVVGVSPDVNQRCAFGQFIAAEIRSESVAAVPSCDAMSISEPLTLEIIERAIAAHQVYSVLATRLVGMELGAKEGGTSDTRGGAYYKATDVGYAPGYHGVHGVPEFYAEFQTAPSIMAVNGEIELATKPYETRGATLVHELNTKARNLESRAAGLVEITAPIAKRPAPGRADPLALRLTCGRKERKSTTT